MYFNMKKTLKNNHNHIFKQATEKKKKTEAMK